MLQELIVDSHLFDSRGVISPGKHVLGFLLVKPLDRPVETSWETFDVFLGVTVVDLLLDVVVRKLEGRPLRSTSHLSHGCEVLIHLSVAL